MHKRPDPKAETLHLKLSICPEERAISGSLCYPA